MNQSEAALAFKPKKSIWFFPATYMFFTFFPKVKYSIEQLAHVYANFPILPLSIFYFVF
jgi:hypothetical protein